jgi:hypothetical protein
MSDPISEIYSHIRRDGAELVDMDVGIILAAANIGLEGRLDVFIIHRRYIAYQGRAIMFEGSYSPSHIDSRIREALANHPEIDTVLINTADLPGLDVFPPSINYVYALTMNAVSRFARLGHMFSAPFIHLQSLVVRDHCLALAGVVGSCRTECLTIKRLIVHVDEDRPLHYLERLRDSLPLWKAGRIVVGDVVVKPANWSLARIRAGKSVADSELGAEVVEEMRERVRVLLEGRDGQNEGQRARPGYEGQVLPSAAVERIEAVNEPEPAEPLSFDPIEPVVFEAETPEDAYYVEEGDGYEFDSSGSSDESERDEEGGGGVKRARYMTD